MSTQALAPDGVLIVNKHAGVTSHDIVGMVRRLFGTRAVGHAGTLDPMATGVLVVLLGRAAKATEYLSGGDKRYIATLRLGLTTDTQDTTGTVLTSSEDIPAETAVQAVLASFHGEIMQLPPMYSALKVGGQKLVDLARQGVTVERKARPVTVHALTATSTDVPTDYTLDVTCSGGTYIRTLCEDIGNALGCGGVMASLCRAQACGFSLEESVTIEQLESMDKDERLALLRPTETLFSHLPSLTLPSFYDRLIGNGCAVALTKLKTCLPLGTRVRLYHAGGSFFALGEVISSDEGLALKSIKTFVL
jgi:tRNA pseudouridine55 synthase